MEGNDGAREPLVDLNEFTSDEYNLLRFEQYLVQRSLKNQLEFCWAVQGLKSLNKDSIQTAGQFVLAIYKNYFQTGEVHVSDEIKADVKNQIKNRNYSPEVFDEAANEVWHFLESEVYVDFLNYAENAEDLPLELEGDTAGDLAASTVGDNDQDDVSGGTVDVESKDDSDPTENATSANADIDLNSEFEDSGTSSQTFKQPWKYKPRSTSAVPKSFSTTWLEPPKESDEFERNSSQRSASPSDASTAVVGLTREALKATQKIRATAKLLPPSSVCKLRPKNPYVYTNNSYNPVSRQDSEVQSFSSGCLTDNDSVIETRSKRSYRKDEGSCHNASEFQPKPHGQIFFRGKQKEQAELYSDPKKFAEILIQKLNEVKWQREYEERNKSRHDERMTPHDLAKAIKDKLCVDEGPADDILDQHVSRVWSDTTPDSRSPPGRYRRSKVPAGASAAIRPRVHTKEPEHLTKSRTFPTGPKYDQFDSGISVVTNSTTEDFVSSWVRDSGRLAKLNPSSNPLRNKKKEIQCFVTYQEQEQVPFCFKIPTLNVNLALFKEYMPKKGNYRYFFKCNGADGVVMEEKCKDDELVPCFEGKIVANLRHV